MKKETRLQKLNELLGLAEKVPDAIAKDTGRVVGFTEEEIQTARELQGLHYFLQAPRLFTPKTCPHCGENFLVSRKYVKFCSYTCITKDLEKIGLKFRKGDDLELLANDPQVWDGNEPLWIREPILSTIREMVNSFSEPEESEKKSNISDSTEASPQEPSTTSTLKETTQSSQAPGPTGATNAIGKTTSKKRKPSPKRSFSFG